MSEFMEKLVLVLVQYLLVGLVVGFAGYLFSRALEHHKAREAVAGEIAKQRVRVIAECWSETYRWEATLNSLIRRAAELQVEHSGARDAFQAAAIRELTPIEAKSREQAGAVRAKVEENRFWLGEGLYAEFRDYSNRLMAYLSGFAECDASQFRSLEEDIERRRGSLSKALNQAI